MITVIDIEREIEAGNVARAEWLLKQITVPAQALQIISEELFKKDIEKAAKGLSLHKSTSKNKAAFYALFKGR